MELDKNGETKKTILICGVSSFLGSNLARFLRQDYRVIGTYYSNPIHIEGVFTIPCDITSRDNIKLLLYKFKPTYVVYCIGVSSLTEGAKNGAKVDALNINSMMGICEMGHKYRIKIIFFSSGYVFSGEDRNFLEIDIPDSNTHLGIKQLTTELFLQKNILDFLIFRTCRLYGRGMQPFRPNFFERFEYNSSQKKITHCDDNVVMGFIDVCYLAMILKLCLKNNIHNRILHISSKDFMTTYEFFKKYCDIFSISENYISKTKSFFPHVTLYNKIQENFFYKLDGSNVERIFNVSIPTIEESLKFTFKRFHGESGVDKDVKSEKISFI